jgi:hypothetical protein
MSNLEFFFPKIGKLVKFTPGKKKKKNPEFSQKNFKKRYDKNL